jgi:hypothetical protein
LDAIEKAIRNAFERGDPSQRPFREKVYRSAFSALDKSLKANPNVTPDVVARRRQALSNTISQIESEFIPAVRVDPERRSAPVGSGSAAPTVAVPGDPRHSPRSEAVSPGYTEPALEADDRPRGGQQGEFEDEIEPPDPAGYRSRNRPRRALFAAFVTFAVLAVIAVAGWWAIDAGWLQQSDDTPPRPTAEEEDFVPEEGDARPRIAGNGSDLRDWIVVFDPSDPTTVAAPGDSGAEVMGEEGEQFIRITSGASGAPVLFDIGQGVLEQIAGGRAVFNVVAQAPDGSETEISVDCNLGELGDCGRKRYAVGTMREEFLFEMELPDVAPGAGGTIAINPDIDGGGKPVDIYEIRVTSAP